MGGPVRRRRRPGLLDAVIAWVEDDEAPDLLTAVQTAGRGGGVVRTSGRGDTDDAESFGCAADF